MHDIHTTEQNPASEKYGIFVHFVDTHRSAWHSVGLFQGTVRANGKVGGGTRRPPSQLAVIGGHRLTVHSDGLTDGRYDRSGYPRQQTTDCLSVSNYVNQNGARNE
jgi:hypothetical protein